MIGSALIGQNFTSRQVFPWPAVGDHGARSEGSDQDRSRCRMPRTTPAARTLGPTSKALVDRVKARRREAGGGESRHADPGRSGHHVGERA